MLADRINAGLLKRFPPSIIGTELTYEDISKRLNTAFRHMKIRIRLSRSDIIAETERVRHTFDCRGWTEGDKIYINILVSPHRTFLRFTPAFYRNFLFHVSMVIQHELVHRSQVARYPHAFYRRLPIEYSSRIGLDRKRDMWYYSEWREIDAYAHDVAMEIRFWYPEYDPYQIVRHIERYPKLHHFRRYLHTFRGTEWDHIRRMLIRKIIRWLPTAKPPLDKQHSL